MPATPPWYSSFASAFNFDYHFRLVEALAPVEYNYRDQAELQRLGLTWHLAGEQPGLSVFLRDGERVYHCYSTYGRGLDILMGTYNYLDLTPFGRLEGWEGMPDLNGLGMTTTAPRRRRSRQRAAAAARRTAPEAANHGTTHRGELK